MAPVIKAPAPERSGDPLRIGRETVSFGRNILLQTPSRFELQHRLFVNDPWELIAEAIHRAVPAGPHREIAHSFRRQAEDYFRAAAYGRELAVRPVLLYYAFLNLSKTYGVARGNFKLTGRTQHGVAPGARKPRAIPGSLIKFDRRGVPVFQEFLQLQGGNAAVTSSDLKLGYLLPQILPGHRLWCYATRQRERFFSVEEFEIRHLPSSRQVWLNLLLDRDNLGRLGLTESKALSEADLAQEFEIVVHAGRPDSICFQQRRPEIYTADPAEALARIISKMQNRVWETVKISSPYRKPYIYCAPSLERKARMPQLMSIYLLMFFLGSVTRYSPLYFEELLDSKYGPFFDTFISESPEQFLYLMASDILRCEVSKPAII